MARAELLIDGFNFSFSGDVEDAFLKFTNNLTASRDGRIWDEATPKVPKVTVGDIRVTPSEFELLKEAIMECSSRRFVVTVAFDSNCAEPGAVVTYTGCMIQGDPTNNWTQRKITGLEFGYENSVTK